MPQLRVCSPRHRPLVHGYENIDGRLMRRGFASSSFQRSCPQYGLKVDRQRVFLWGRCKTRRGQLRDSRVEVENIDNDNGNLVHGFR